MRTASASYTREEHVRQHDGVEADRIDFVSGLSELHDVVFGGRSVERGVHREPGALRGAVDGQLQGLPVLAVADEHAARGHVERRRQAARPSDDPPFRGPANSAFRGPDGGAADEDEQLRGVARGARCLRARRRPSQQGQKTGSGDPCEHRRTGAKGHGVEHSRRCTRRRKVAGMTAGTGRPDLKATTGSNGPPRTKSTGRAASSPSKGRMPSASFTAF